VPTLPTATAEVTVDASPEDAFRIFTEEIGIWWRRNTPYWNDSERGLSVRIEPGVGGRFIEVYDLDSESGFEVGRVTAWEPGMRLALTWTQVGWPKGAATDLEITFESQGENTLVRLEQTGFERVGTATEDLREAYSGGWKQVLCWFADQVNRKEAQMTDGATQATTGKIVWFEIPARDTARARGFYGELFGWRF
jgi:uncharacterized protein YndB with AHSA1/START domain